MNDPYAITTAPRGTERRPPYAEDAEQAVLAAGLISGAAFLSVLDVVDDTMFYAERHRRLFRAMVALLERGSIIDPVTLADHLERQGELETAGGKVYIGFLIDAVPTETNILYHAGIVREKAHLRRLIEAAQEIQREAFHGDQPARALAQDLAAKLLPLSLDDRAATGFRRVKQDVWSIIETIEAQAANPDKPRGIQTGYTTIDNETGGLMEGELLIIGGTEGMGKSALAMNMAVNIAATERQFGGGGVGYVSAEMTRGGHIRRCLAILGRIEALKLRKGTLVDADWHRLAQAAGQLAALPLWIDDESEPSLTDVRSRCRALKSQNPDLRTIVVDFLQLVRLRGSEANRNEQLTDIAYSLAGMGKELGVGVIAPCQVNSKDVEKGGDMRPLPKDLQGSSGMRQAADFLALLFRPAVYDPTADRTMFEAHFAKARDAAPFTAFLSWDGPTVTLSNRGREAA